MKVAFKFSATGRIIFTREVVTSSPQSHLLFLEPTCTMTSADRLRGCLLFCFLRVVTAGLGVGTDVSGVAVLHDAALLVVKPCYDIPLVGVRRVVDNVGGGAGGGARLVGGHRSPEATCIPRSDVVKKRFFGLR